MYHSSLGSIYNNTIHKIIHNYHGNKLLIKCNINIGLKSKSIKGHELNYCEIVS